MPVTPKSFAYLIVSIYISILVKDSISNIKEGNADFSTRFSRYSFISSCAICYVISDHCNDICLNILKKLICGNLICSKKKEVQLLKISLVSETIMNSKIDFNKSGEIIHRKGISLSL